MAGHPANPLPHTPAYCSRSLLPHAVPRTTQRTPCHHSNSAVSASRSLLSELCLERLMDADVDLVFVEFVLNDGVVPLEGVCEPPAAKAYERLVRKVLRRPSAPAVVLITTRGENSCSRPM